MERLPFGNPFPAILASRFVGGFSGVLPFAISTSFWCVVCKTGKSLLQGDANSRFVPNTLPMSFWDMKGRLRYYPQDFDLADGMYPERKCGSPTPFVEASAIIDRLGQRRGPHSPYCLCRGVGDRSLTRSTRYFPPNVHRGLVLAEAEEHRVS